jgi:hypothetical protein
MRCLNAAAAHARAARFAGCAFVAMQNGHCVRAPHFHLRYKPRKVSNPHKS